MKTQIEGSNSLEADNRDVCKDIHPPAQLSSPDKETRERGFTLLETWLSRRKEIDENDMRKIWQGLLSCLGYADSRAWQVCLIKRIASVFGIIHPSMSIAFFFAFLCTLRSKWDGIESGKIRRFYSLLQTCLNEILTSLQRECWKKEMLKRLNDCFLENVLTPKEYRLAHSINIQLSQVLLEGVEKVLPLSYAAIKQTLEPVWKVFAAVKDKVLLRRGRDMFLPFMEEAQHILLEAEEHKNSLNYLVVNLLFVQRVYKLATSPTSCDMSRSLTDQFHEERKKVAVRLPAGAAHLTRKISVTSEYFGPSDPFPITKVEAAFEETDSHYRSANLCAREVLQQPGTDGAKVELCQAASAGKLTNGHLSKAGEKSFSIDKGVLNDCVPPLELSNEASKDENCNYSQEKSLALDTKKRKKAAVDMENHASRSPKRRRLWKGSESNPHIVSRKHLQEICNRLEGAANGGEKAKGEKLVTQGISTIHTYEENGSISLLVPPVPSMLLPSPINKGSKRKKERDPDEGVVMDETLEGSTNVVVSNICLVQERRKRVKISLEDNIVWQPHMPLPPKSLRVPPSARPRGSALKKGSLPGPVIIQGTTSYLPGKLVANKRTTKSPYRGKKRRRHGNQKQLKT